MATLKMVDDAVIAMGRYRVVKYVVESVIGSSTKTPEEGEFVVLQEGMAFEPFFPTTVEQVLFQGRVKGCLAFGDSESTCSFASARVTDVDIVEAAPKLFYLRITTQNAVYVAHLAPEKKAEVVYMPPMSFRAWFRTLFGR